MADFNRQQFATYLRANISPQPFGEGRCAHFVRLALAAGGLTPANPPEDAKDWGATLLALGFAVLDADPAQAVMGDLAVLQPPAGEPPFGHLQGFDGANWISDFIQRDFWPGPAYRAAPPPFALYRWALATA